jgi:nucleoside phosphorylase
MRATVEEAREVLADLPGWWLSDRQWQRVIVLLQTVDDAIGQSDRSKLAGSVAALEAAGPARTTPLGSVPLRPAPRLVRLLVSRLVHRIGPGAPDGGGPMRVRPGPPTRPPGSPLAQELVVHVFAPADGPTAATARQQLTALWTRCRDAFATTEPVPGLALPTDLAAALADLTADGPVAAQQSGDLGVQLIAHRHEDVLSISLACRAPGRTWAEWDRRWHRLAVDAVDAALGIVRIHTGITDDGRTPEDTLASNADELWYAEGLELLPGCVLWELPPYDDARRDRSIVVVGPGDRRADLSALVWSRGDSAMTPFSRYLAQMAKVRYEIRVLNASRPHPAGAATIAELKDLRLAVDVARANMVTLLARAGLDGVRGGAVQDDREVADWLERQVRCDIERLENALGSVGSPSRTGRTPSIGIVTAMPEEFVAMRSLIDDPEPAWIRGDPADYVVGTIPSAEPGHPHIVVLTLLADTGTGYAAASAANLVRSFEAVSHIIMVGVAAGVPRPELPTDHVRLGDIVVASWGVVDYDHVVDGPDGPRRRQEFPRPAALLTARARRLSAEELIGSRPWEGFLATLVSRHPDFQRPADDTDILYADDDGEPPVAHPDPASSGHRPGLPKVHHGRIGSADRSIRNRVVRDRLAREHGLRAFEMEGKGVGDAAFNAGRQWFMVRGVSDYGDEHLTHLWRPYASAVAAAYVRALLDVCPLLRTYPSGLPTNPHQPVGHAG